MKDIYSVHNLLHEVRFSKQAGIRSAKFAISSAPNIKLTSRTQQTKHSFQ